LSVTLSGECSLVARLLARGGRLLPRIFPHHERLEVARVQNDWLLALTARSYGRRAGRGRSPVRNDSRPHSLPS